GLFTARSLAKMYAALAGGGAIDGVRLLSPETLARATEGQSPAPARLVIPFDMRWRLGYHGVLTTRGVPPRAVGHFRLGGSGAGRGVGSASAGSEVRGRGPARGASLPWR